MTLCDIHGQPYPPEVEARMLAPEPGEEATTEGAEEMGNIPETPEAPVADVSVTTPGEEPKKLEE